MNHQLPFFPMQLPAFIFRNQRLINKLNKIQIPMMNLDVLKAILVKIGKANLHGPPAYPRTFRFFCRVIGIKLHFMPCAAGTSSVTEFIMDVSRVKILPRHKIQQP